MTVSAHVTKLVRIKPDALIELAQRMKSQAMDYAYPGEVVMVPLTGEITLLYEPEQEFCKPLTRLGYVPVKEEESAG